MSRNKFESSIFSLADRISKELLKRKDRQKGAGTRKIYIPGKKDMLIFLVIFL